MTRNKKGLTLIETIVTIAIFFIGVEGFSLLFIKAWKVNSFTLEEGAASLAASRGVQSTIDIIRNARQADNGSFPIVSADDNDLVIYGNIDGDSDTERVHYYLSSGTLRVGVTDPTTNVPPVYPVGDQTTADVATHIINDAGSPVFEYYDIDNNLLTTPSTVNSVKMVKVHLEINIDPVRAPNNINIQSYATIRNLSEYDRAN